VDDPALEHRARLLKGQGVDPDRRYFFPITGYNYRLTNLACAILCAQMERASEIVARRRGVYARYRAGLEGVAGIGFQPQAAWAEVAPWLFSITVDAKAYGRTRDELAALLADKGVETRPFFRPLHRLPPFWEESRRRGEVLPVTDRLGEAGLNLPTYTQLQDREVDLVSAAIREGRR
jgi:perosamine synthetase